MPSGFSLQIQARTVALCLEYLRQGRLVTRAPGLPCSVNSVNNLRMKIASNASVFTIYWLFKKQNKTGQSGFSNLQLEFKQNQNMVFRLWAPSYGTWWERILLNLPLKLCVAQLYCFMPLVNTVLCDGLPAPGKLGLQDWSLRAVYSCGKAVPMPKGKVCVRSGLQWKGRCTASLALRRPATPQS